MDESPEHRIRRLTLSFPTLRAAYGGETPWDAGQLDHFACQPVSCATRHAARFVLAVWDSGTAWGCGRFEVVEAMDAWDADHRQAFLDWASSPWWA